jgi:hypothetical protein
MRFAPDHSGTLEVFFLPPTDSISGHLYVSQSVVREMATVHLQPRIILQQDGAPPQWCLQVRAFLDRTFPGRWIGRDEIGRAHV